MSITSTPESAGFEAQQAAHTARLSPYVEPHLKRRHAGIKHPVHDFLFTYYNYRPAQLMRWQPAGSLDPAKRQLASNTLKLLQATAQRQGNLGCFGLHEWAMVYKADETRHPQALRLGSSGTDSVVESHKVSCSHWDAVRFFTPPALPLNSLTPGPRDRTEFEQPSCFHATMDLYKHAHRLDGLVGSDLVADAFELAWEVRIADMRAAPYDMSGVTLDPLGSEWSPIKIETPAGKREYVDLQRGFTERAIPIRQALIERLEQGLIEVETGVILEAHSQP